jgi:hypothetical protein
LPVITCVLLCSFHSSGSVLRLLPCQQKGPPSRFSVICLLGLLECPLAAPKELICVPFHLRFDIEGVFLMTNSKSSLNLPSAFYSWSLHGAVGYCETARSTSSLYFTHVNLEQHCLPSICSEA